MKHTLPIASLILAAAFLATAQKTPESLLGAALHQEEVQGDLKGAIAAYQKVVATRGVSRKTAAEALIHMAGCYQKMGDAESQKIYERVVKDYADQTESVALAQARMAKLVGGGTVTQPATRLVWSGPKADGDSVSPDGRYLSYTDWNTGNLILHDVATNTDRALTTNGSMTPGASAFADGSVFSRDGKQIAWSWDDGKTKGDRDETWVAELGGDPRPRRLFDGDAYPYDWSPDGKWIVVVSSAADNHTGQLALLPAQGGTPRALKSWPTGTHAILSAGFSPDGKYIVYTSRAADGSTRGFILSADGRSETDLASGSSASPFTVRWSPDGSRIVWASGAPNTAQRALWSIRVANGKPVGKPEQLKSNFGNSFLVGFARDGSLFYGANLPESDIYLAGLDPASGKLTSVPRRINGHGSGDSNGRIAWLPDGKSLSFWSQHEGNSGLVVHALATGEEHELWEHPMNNNAGPGYTGWFSDGSVMSQQRNTQSTVFRRLDNRTLEMQATWALPFLGNGAPIGYSRDLMTQFSAQKDPAVPCESNACNYVLSARDLQTGGDREVCRFTAATRVANLSRSASPDDRQLALLVGYRGHDSVMTVPTTGGSPREIYRSEESDLAGLANMIDWTQDGRHVLAFYGEDGREELWSFPVNGGPPEKSTLHVGLNGKLNSAVSPDGTQLAFVGGTRRSEIWVMPSPFYAK